MSTLKITKQFHYNNQILEDTTEIPSNARFTCANLGDDGTLLFIEDHRNGRLYAIEIPDTLSDSRAKAVETVKLAEESGTLTEEAIGVPIYIHREPTDFALGFELEEGEMYIVKEGFIYDPAEDEKILQNSKVPFPYTAEIGTLEPPMILRRGLFNKNKQLMVLEYLFYGFDSAKEMRELYSFSEYTSAGEQWLMLARANDDQESGGASVPYVFPANRDSYYESVEHFLAMDYYAAFDEHDEAIENVAEHSFINILFYDKDSNPLSSRKIVDKMLTEFQVFDVPLESHCFVVHAVFRRLHSDITLMANTENSDNSCYIKIFSPVFDESSDEITLEPGEVREHVTFYHFNGDYIAHKCAVRDEEGNNVKTLVLTSPFDHTIVKSYSYREWYDGP